MRRVNLIFLLLISYTVYGQKPQKNTQKNATKVIFAVDSADWITDDLEGSLTFYKNQSADATLKDMAVADFGIYSAPGKYKVVKDTLMIIHEYDGSDHFDTTKRHRVEKFSFLIKHIDKLNLVLAPVVKSSKSKPTATDIDSTAYIDFAGRTRTQQPEYYFENLQYAIDKTFKFKQIYFKLEPGLTIQIDNSGSYYLRGEHVDSNKYNGSFKGKFSNKQLDTLNDLLRRSRIRKMQNWPSGKFAADAKEYELLIDYDDDKLVVKTDTLPICITELIAFLEESYKKVTLVAIKQ